MTDLFVELRGLRHHVVDYGGEGPVVFLLHGYLDLARLFDKLASRLRGFRLLAPDFRGHGDSSWVPPGGYYHFPDYVADLHGLVGALAGGAKVRIVGHSMGGGVATYLTGAFPELVEKLCLIEAIGPPAEAFDHAPNRMRAFVEDLVKLPTRRARRFATIEEAAARVRANNPGLAADDALHYARENTRAGDDGQLVWKFDPLHQTRAPQLFLEEVAIPFLRKIACPTLFIEGARGYILEEGQRSRRLGALAHVDTARIPDAGHHVHLDQPDAVAARLAEFLR